ncbi:MAG: dephospho-CoA kinase [Gammaproteobacteria bacterium]|nr:dephospho-CoA kinase [Gammaproteobacteria bacterium]MCZ6773215.1 dephospho-CoA kinase [Pseudomonadota bacterium]
MRAYIVGVTGGIGSGKTTICDEFAGCHRRTVIDADIVAREVVEPGQTALAEIVDAFGADVLDATGRLDRAHLKRMIFADETRRNRLEHLLHPRIRARIESKVDAVDDDYCLLCIPLLAEGKAYELIDRILVVDCPESLQLARVQQRDDLTEQEVTAIMRTQASRKARLQIADDVILNDGDIAQLADRVEQLHHSYVKLSASRA